MFLGVLIVCTAYLFCLCLIIPDFDESPQVKERLTRHSTVEVIAALFLVPLYVAYILLKGVFTRKP